MTTYFSTAPDGEPDYASADGRPDRVMHENEARLWLLSQAEREAGVKVEFDEDVQRWVRAGGVAAKADKRCEICRKIFQPSRSSALYCSDACKQSAARKRAGVTLTGRLVSQ